MCGLVGAISKASNGFSRKGEDIFYQLLGADQVRGDDATGIVFVEKDKSFGIIKTADPASHCIDAIKRQAMATAQWTKGTAMIGHNRKATMGGLSDAAAHPFVIDKKFAMVHNGTLTGHKQLADTVGDSEALAIHLSKVLNKGYTKEKLEEALVKVYGAYAIVAYHQDTNLVYMLRNAERPFHYADTSEGFFWASEPLMLAWILVRNGVALEKIDMHELPVHTLLTFDLSKNEITKEVLTVKKYQPVVYQATGPKHGGVGGTKKEVVPPSVATPIVSKNEFKRLRKKYLGTYIRFFAEDFVEKYFPKTIADGEVEILLLGDAEDLDFMHSCSASCDINELNLAEGTELCNSYYTGKVYEMDYHRSGHVTMRLSSVLPVPLSSVITKGQLVH